jgi:hypothetical protein
MAVAKTSMNGVDVEQLETTESAANEKAPNTAYVADTEHGSHHKSAAERRLILKCDLLIVPLAALIYFVAYLVIPILHISITAMLTG